VLDRHGFVTLGAMIIALLLASGAARADTLTDITTQASQGANDSVIWSQLGADATLLVASNAATSSHGNSVTAALTGANSIISVVCAASPCSWAGGTSGSAPFSAGDSLIWTSDAGSSGNGPLTITLGTKVSGAGALIQEDAPGQFQANIQVFNGATSLGSFSESSDSSGDPIYIGVKDTSGTNISKIVFSINSTTNAAGNVADFAVDAVQLNAPAVPTTTTSATPTITRTATPTFSPTPSGPTPTTTLSPTLTQTPTHTATRSPTITATATATLTPTATATVSGPALLVNPTSLNFGTVKVGHKSAIKKVTLKNSAPKGGQTITISNGSVADFPEFFIFNAGAGICHIGTVLKPQGHCILKLGFQPGQTGFRSDTLTVEDNASNSPQQVPLSGTGK